MRMEIYSLLPVRRNLHQCIVMSHAEIVALIEATGSSLTDGEATIGIQGPGRFDDVFPVEAASNQGA